MKSGSRAFLRGAGYSIAGVVVSGVSGYLVRRILIGHLDRASYGFFYSALAAMTLFSSAIGAGLAQATCVLVAKYARLGDPGRARSVFGHVFVLRVGVAALAAAGMLLAAPWLMATYFRFTGDSTAFLLVCLWLPVVSALGSVQSLIYARMDFAVYSLIDATQYILMAVIVWLSAASFGVTGAAAGLLAGAAAVLPLSLGWAAARHGIAVSSASPPVGVLSETLRFARWAVATTSGVTLLMTLDTLLLTRLSGLETVAVYQVAVPVAQLFQLIMVLPPVLVPVAADLWHAGRGREIDGIMRLLSQTALLYGGVLIVFLIPSAEAVIRVLFGAGFDAAVLPLWLLCAGVPVLVIAQSLVNMLAAVGRPHRAAGVTAVAVVACAGLHLVLIPRFGMAGAAAATSLGYAVWAVLARGALTLERPLHILGGPAVRIGASALVAGGLGALVRRVTDNASLRLAAAAGLVLLFLLLVWPLLWAALQSVWRLFQSMRRGPAGPADAPAPGA